MVQRYYNSRFNEGSLIVSFYGDRITCAIATPCLGTGATQTLTVEQVTSAINHLKRGDYTRLCNGYIIHLTEEAGKRLLIDLEAAQDDYDEFEAEVVCDACGASYMVRGTAIDLARLLFLRCRSCGWMAWVEAAL